MVSLARVPLAALYAPSVGLHRLLVLCLWAGWLGARQTLVEAALDACLSLSPRPSPVLLSVDARELALQVELAVDFSA